MPQILQGGGNAATLAGVDDVYVLVQPPASAALPGAQTNVIGLVGSAPWGPTNTAVTVGSGADLATNFGLPTTATYDMPTDALLCLQSGANNLRCVRVTDGTDTAALIKVNDNTGFATATVTVGGTFASGVALTVTIGGVSVPYTTQTSDTNLSGIATSLAAAINAAAPVAGPNATIQKATAAGAVITLTALVQGTAGNSITLAVSGTGVTLTPSGATFASGAVPGTFATLTARYTGSFPNGSALIPGATCVVSAGSQSTTTSPTLRAVITFPNSVPEVYDNIIAYASAGGGYSGSTAQSNFVNAINGTPQLNALRPASAFFSATAGGSTVTPQTVNANPVSTNGSDGASSISTTNLLGSPSATPQTGLYALSGAIGGGQFALSGCTDVQNAGPAMSAFALAQNAHAVISFAKGTSTATAIGNKQTYGVASYGITVLKDFIEFADSVNNITARQVSGAPIALALMATTSPETSPANKRANVITGTERTGAVQNVPYTPAELAQLEAAGINLFANPCPGGAYFGLRHNKNSLGQGDPRGNIAYSMMTKYLAQSYASTLIGQFVGMGQTKQSGDRVREKVRSAYNDFNERLRQSNVIDSHYVQCDLKNNSNAAITAGVLRADITVAYVAVVDRIVASLTGGQTVKVNVLPQAVTAQT